MEGLQIVLVGDCIAADVVASIVDDEFEETTILAGHMHRAE
jgi:hypothetical protein